MSKYQLINIKDNNLEFSEKYWLHILQGVWRPEKISTKPLKITFNKNIFPIYICKEINEDLRRIILNNTDNTNIIIEIIIINHKKIIFNVLNKLSLGVTPKITFIK